MNIRIAHAALYAKNLEKSKDYYVTFFGGQCGPLYQSNHGFSSYFLTFEDGAKLEVMHDGNIGRWDTAEAAGGWSHLAFSVGSRENVRAVTQKIADAGYPLYSGPRQTGDGCFESCVADPDGNRVEITI